VADDDHRFAASGDRRAQGLGVSSRGQALVGLRFGVERTGDLACCLACPQQRAREDGVRANAVGGEPATELARGGVPRRCQWSQVVGLTRGGLGVADEKDAHAARIRADRRLGAMGRYRYVVCDVFTDKALTGNQLAVFTDARELPEARLQELAREMNFSETVFVYPSEAGHARIRIFTPTAEVSFAGHPTLGSAFVLAGPLQLDEISLETGKGVVPIRLEREGARIVFGRMEQPIPTIEPYAEAPWLLEALGVERSELPVELYDNGLPNVYVVLQSDDVVAGLRPDLARLSALPDVIGINCLAGSGSHWKTRMFAPAGGVAEDPATGSAAGPLALHLARHGLIAFGDEIEITQGVEIHRPSKLYARVDGSPDRVERVEVGGSAVVVARGEFQL
jgi:trans-2,3-dihydro-3-hydroxyanthranilate isomerase